MSFNKQRNYYARNNFCSFRTLPPPSQSLITTNTVAEKITFNKAAETLSASELKTKSSTSFNKPLQLGSNPVNLLCFGTLTINFEHFSEAVAQRCSVKKVFLEISQNPQENTFFYRTPLVAASELSATKQLKA